MFSFFVATKNLGRSVFEAQPKRNDNTEKNSALQSEISEIQGDPKHGNMSKNMRASKKKRGKTEK